MATKKKDTLVKELIQTAIEAGRARDYVQAIKILEDLAAQGFAEKNGATGTPSGERYPEIYLYLARAWHAKKNYPRALVYGNVYVRNCPTDPAGWFFLGRSYLLANKYEKAILALQKSLALNDKSIEVRALLGAVYLKAKKASLAREVFEQALALDPSNKRLNAGYLNALFVESVHLLRSGNADMARQMFSFVIKKGVDGVAPRLYLGHALRAMKHLPEALSQYEAAVELAPDDPALLWYPAMIMMEMGDSAGASEILSKMGINVDGTEMTEQFLSIGVVRKHLEENDWVKAASAARLYIKYYGGSVEIHLLMAEAQRSMGKINNALNHYVRAMEIEPENPFSHYGMMMTLQSAGRWDELAKELERAERSECDPSDIYYYKIITAAHIDNPPEEVLPHIQALLKQNSSDPFLFNSLGRTYVRLDMADLALGWYQKALSLNENDEEAHVGLIACYENLCLHDELYNEYKGYLNQWSDNVIIRRDFIFYLESLEKWSEAADEVETLASQVRSINFESRLAIYRRKAGEYRKAAILYRNMLRQKPEEKILLHNLVYCLDKMGQTKEAITLLQASRKIFGEQLDLMIIEGIIYLRDRKISAAMKVFQYLAEKYPKDKRIHEFLNKVYKTEQSSKKKGSATTRSTTQQTAKTTKPMSQSAGKSVTKVQKGKAENPKSPVSKAATKAKNPKLGEKKSVGKTLVRKTEKNKALDAKAATKTEKNSSKPQSAVTKSGEKKEAEKKTGAKKRVEKNLVAKAEKPKSPVSKVATTVKKTKAEKATAKKSKSSVSKTATKTEKGKVEKPNAPASKPSAKKK